MEILSAQANGFTLFVLAGLIAYEGVSRLVSPPQPEGLPILVVALLGIVVNLAATRQLARADRSSLNIEGSFQHILTDLFAFIATAIAGVVILATGWGCGPTRSRRSSSRRSCWSPPTGSCETAAGCCSRRPLRAASVDEIGKAIATHPHVASVHDLHVWEVSSGFPSLSAHVLVACRRRLPRDPARAGARSP